MVKNNHYRIDFISSYFISFRKIDKAKRIVILAFLVSNFASLLNTKVVANSGFGVEVDILSRLDHPNLVSLIGYCADGKNRFLVYEYMLNGNLEDHLNGWFQINARTQFSC